MSRAGVTVALGAAVLVGVGVALVVGLPRERAIPNRHTRAAVTLGDSARSRARSIFVTRCAGCHGTRMEGGVGPTLVGVEKRRTLERIEEIIVRGKGRKKAVPMPGGLASAQEARLLASWLAAQGKPWP